MTEDDRPLAERLDEALAAITAGRGRVLAKNVLPDAARHIEALTDRARRAEAAAKALYLATPLDAGKRTRAEQAEYAAAVAAYDALGLWCRCGDAVDEPHTDCENCRAVREMAE